MKEFFIGIIVLFILLIGGTFAFAYLSPIFSLIPSEYFIILLVQSTVFGAFCAFIAGEKKRSRGAWFALGAFFSLIALLALVAVPKKEEN